MGWPIELNLSISFFISFSMWCLFWNCQGAGNDDFKSTMHDLQCEHEPNIVAIFKTKVPFAKMVIILGFV